MTHVRRMVVIGNQTRSMIAFRAPLLAELASRGIAVHALAPDIDGASRRRFERLGVSPIEISLVRGGLMPIADTCASRQIYDLLRVLRPDAVLSYYMKPVVFGGIAARLSRIGSQYAMLGGLGYAFSEDPRRVHPRRIALRFSLERVLAVALSDCRKVIFQNHDDARLLQEKRIVRSDQVVVVPGSGVDLNEYEFSRITVVPPTFIMISRLLREKGVREYVAAARNLRRAVPSARFILVGDIDANPGSLSEKEVTSWVEEGAVEWPGHTADVRPWLRASSVFVLPSWREGLPRSTQEAMAMGRPVITTDVPGCRETVEHGRNGFLVPPRNVPALEAAMRQIIRDPILSSRMGYESRRIAELKFDVRKINSAILDVMGVGTVDS
jgi:glycosyltransferase involved in cell wall biosynthesis